MRKKDYVNAVRNIAEYMQQEECRELYEQAIHKTKEIVEKIISELERKSNREITNSISGRIKKPESISRKLQKKGLEVTFFNAVSMLNDLVGIRIACYYLDDVKRISDELMMCKDIHILKVKDYISNPKKSGYRSLHLIAKVPVVRNSSEEWIKVEIQIRTMAMDLWARLDHKLCYKRELNEVQSVRRDLQECAEIVEKVDVRMMHMRQKTNV